VFGVSQTLALCIGNHGIMAARLTHNGTAVVLVNVTWQSIRPWNCPVMPGNCPGTSQVWRGICAVACGWLRYRVTMMQGFEWLKR